MLACILAIWLVSGLIVLACAMRAPELPWHD